MFPLKAFVAPSPSDPRSSRPLAASIGVRARGRRGQPADRDGRRDAVIDNAGKASDAEKYYNLRSEVWCTAADMFADGDAELKNVEPQLRGQLATPTYEFRNGRILIESKADIKQRLGRSPDRADAYVNGLYALQFVEGWL